MYVYGLINNGLCILEWGCLGSVVVKGILLKVKGELNLELILGHNKYL